MLQFIGELAVSKTDVQDLNPHQLERAQRRQLQQALRNQDLERRLFEARQLIESAENN
nr:hypothetical protein [Rubripirellula sp.]